MRKVRYEMTSEEAWAGFQDEITSPAPPTEGHPHLHQDLLEGWAKAYADACVREALADYTAEKLQAEALKTGTLFGAPISDLQVIYHLTRELNISIDKLRERVEAQDPLAMLEALAKIRGSCLIPIRSSSGNIYTHLQISYSVVDGFAYRLHSAPTGVEWTKSRAEAEALLKGGE